MNHGAHIGQLIGTFVDAALMVAGGIYVRWIRPRRLLEEVQRGQKTQAEANAQLKKLTILGYILFSLAVADVLQAMLRY